MRLVAVACAVLLATQPAMAEPSQAAGNILAPVNRQAAWLNLDAPRPRVLTRVLAPSYVADVEITPVGAIVALQSSLNADQPTIGGDLLKLDLGSGEMSAFVTRSDASESLGAPAWFGSRIAFERQDLTNPAIGYAYQSAVHYPARIETVQPDGSSRTVLIDDARQPSSSPDATQLVYVRSSSQGSAILVGDGMTERELVPVGTFIDAAWPRFSPRGDQIAFAVTTTPVFDEPTFLERLFDIRTAYAHGLPWDIWLMAADGSDPHLLAPVGADDPSLAWSPDGSQLFVYSGTGSFILDVASGDMQRLPYLTGYGAISWVP